MQEASMKQVHLLVAVGGALIFGGSAGAQSEKQSTSVAGTQAGAAMHAEKMAADAATLDAGAEKRALQIFLKSVEKQIVSAAEAMPAVKYGFAPEEGEFKGVRTFGQQVKHLAATNHILAAAALGEEPPADAGDEAGPESVRSKPEILNYLNESFAHLGRAIDAIGEKNMPVKSSPISPLPAKATTRLGLTVEALIHAFNHYGQPALRKESPMAEFIPVACNLTDAAFRERETILLARFKAAASTTTELPDGFAFHAPGEKDWITLLAELMVAERECCPFMRFELKAEPNMGRVTLSVTGPPGAKAFLKKLLCEPKTSDENPAERLTRSIADCLP
jgi:DinB superfamily